ncbi:hypothetical protein D1007_14638 [Hordeum vulgare]|nr:hypothetical protein D1007_14638 [Hordeum vulgare]
MRPKFPISDKAFEEAYHILLLFVENLREVPVSLFSSMRPQPENSGGGDFSALDFAEPRLGPVLAVTREDLEQFDPRDWEEYFRTFSATERSFPTATEIALVIALAVLSLIFAFMARMDPKMRRGGGGRGGGGRSGSGGGGGWSPRGGGLLSLVPRRGAALLARRAFEDAGTRTVLAEADGVVWLARVAATGTSRTRGRVRAEIDLTQRMVAGLRQARSNSQSQEGAAPKIMAAKTQKRRGGGGGAQGAGRSGGGGGGGASPKAGGLLPLAARRGAAALTRRAFEDAGTRNALAEAVAAVWLARVLVMAARRRGRADMEPTRKMMAGLRQARSISSSQEGVAPKVSTLSSFLHKHGKRDPVDHVAAVPSGELLHLKQKLMSDDYKLSEMLLFGTMLEQIASSQRQLVPDKK